MFKLLKEVFRTGEATVKYPFAPVEVCKDFRGKPEHTAANCIACAACTVACPANALNMETDTAAGTRTWSIDYGRCIFCGRCEEVCPTDAIRLSQEFELAVANKADLQRKAVFRLARCVCCGEPFAAEKEVAYVTALIEAMAPSPEEGERRRQLVATCPSCKRANDVVQISDAALVRSLETAR
ncbi:formate hydrogenlyase complex iron-sulfur subunit [Rhodoplanes elegans]|uniref:Formate hydrogenlyase complex iron-sulfur subunit n=1 Tax=Rhodoplanes elegans TaxID=29408 RepID=A0A327KTM4_9BRAD|nr:formate hydrogenlyase complex iron-sulfur subunit [Rhodoplanes elegans]MBK5960052.1 formate hydrogenlyase complex iron-sulfur subunit [Rhodoplanes elegans]RAI41627.1 formate hydrogenlyase complex iron-sulfur subunit [Rhodoplanes elegans]